MVGASQLRLCVFLCHASGDKPVVRELYHRLQRDGFQPWLDEEDLLPGQDWQFEIPRAVRAADVVLVCLSHQAINKEGYVQKEIRFALDIADEKPPGAIFLIPLKIQECSVPERLSRWQWVDLSAPNGYERLIRSLSLRAQSKGIQRPSQVIATPVATTHPDLGEKPPKTVPVDEEKYGPLSPLVRKMARDHQIDLSQVSGTGAGGRITPKDLEAYLSKVKPGTEGSL